MEMAKACRNFFVTFPSALPVSQSKKRILVTIRQNQSLLPTSVPVSLSTVCVQTPISKKSRCIFVVIFQPSAQLQAPYHFHLFKHTHIPLPHVQPILFK
ncbi:hypothetical protein RJT34_10101 [Clitoria ternatea]|uniref:Uncharacterized protein n=1 Tax=Clitoria ternatea TaxID=43366 RepID=A0AAN9PVT7_CLITE